MATKPSSTRRSPKQGSCGGAPRRDGSGGGHGNKGTPRQPRK